MKAKYLLRFDDICATMNWEVWSEIEQILTKMNVKPILAVVPENQDKHLMVADANIHFWEHVRNWQNRGWTIGLHGYQHCYVTENAGLVGLNARSEFAGLSAEEQEIKLQRAVDNFRTEDVDPDVWIAPAHSFDTNTIVTLKKMGIRIISDGFYIYPRVDSQGMLWIPQQLWRFRFSPFGVWTVCYHHNSWSEMDIVKFHADMKVYRDSIMSVDEVVAKYSKRHRNWFDSLFSNFFLVSIKFRRRLKHL